VHQDCVARRMTGNEIYPEMRVYICQYQRAPLFGFVEAFPFLTHYANTEHDVSLELMQPTITHLCVNALRDFQEWTGRLVSAVINQDGLWLEWVLRSPGLRHLVSHETSFTRLQQLALHAGFLGAIGDLSTVALAEMEDEKDNLSRMSMLIRGLTTVISTDVETVAAVGERHPNMPLLIEGNDFLEFNRLCQLVRDPITSRVKNPQPDMAPRGSIDDILRANGKRALFAWTRFKGFDILTSNLESITCTY